MTHARRQARRRRGPGAGEPRVRSGSKPGDTRDTLGPHGFRGLAERLPCPALALGGMTPERAREVPGAWGVAVISAVLEAEDPRSAALALLDACASP